MMRNHYLSTLSRRIQFVRGFTLIELMIGVAIVGILSAIAMPSYKAYILKTRRADAMAALSLAQTNFERCYAANFTYLSPGTCAAPPATSNKGFYTIAAVGTATAYTLTATTAGSQTDDLTCTKMTVDQTNTMNAVDNTGTAQPNCWTR